MYFWGVFSHQAPEKRAPVCSLPSKKRKKVGCWVKHLAVPGFLAFCRGTGIGCLKGGAVVVCGVGLVQAFWPKFPGVALLALHCPAAKTGPC